MTRPAALRRSSVTAALVALAAAGAPVVPTLPVLQAVVSFDGRAVAAPGVEVVTSLRALHMQVVRGSLPALDRLTRTHGVRGVSLDTAMTVTSGEDGTDDGSGVLASAGLGGSAGSPTAGAGVRVAVVDTGVSDTAALNRASGRLVDAVDTSTGVVRTGGRYDDGFGHGTFMANLVAGGGTAGTAGAPIGVAPAATVLVARVAQPDGSTSLSRVLAAFEWVRAHADDVDVVNLALSTRRPLPRYGPDPLTDALERVMAAGVTVAVSAGNKHGQLGDPGFDPWALTVGAADTQGDRPRVATFSGSGDVAGVRKPDVVASGVHVLGLLPPDSALAQASGTLHLANGLFRGTGTSQATAITSGLAAILLAAHPDASPADVKASLACSAVDLPGRRDGKGLVRTTTTVCPGLEPPAPGDPGDDGDDSDGGADASSWGASSWGASSWGASSWGASSWGASSWGASSWAASSWAASSWAASSWAASSWGLADPGERS